MVFLIAGFGFAVLFLMDDDFALIAAFRFVGMAGGGIFSVDYCTAISGTTSTGQWAALSSLSLNEPTKTL